MSEEVNTQQPTTQPEANGDKSRTFNQDEVNCIVSERLKREREKATQPPDAKEQALKAREARLDCREYLDTNKLPAELMDTLDTADVEKFKSTVSALITAFPGIMYTFETRGAQTAHPPANVSEPDTDELIKQAFAPKK